MFVTPEGPKKLYSLYCPSQEYFSRYPANPGEKYTLRREHRAPPLFVPEHAFGKYGALDLPGHRGIYHFDQRHLDFVYEHGDLWDGTQFPHYTSFLPIDLDVDGARGRAVLEKAFKDYDYLLYESGGGPDKYHFILPHNLICNADIARCYVAFMVEAGIYCDGTIWNPTCCIALPGNPHCETGVRKTLIKANSGKRLWFETVTSTAMQQLGKSIFRGE